MRFAGHLREVTTLALRQSHQRFDAAASPIRGKSVSKIVAVELDYRSQQLVRVGAAHGLIAQRLQRLRLAKQIALARLDSSALEFLEL